jgi:hypothetical protein
MNQEPQEKLEVSSDVVKQLNGMVRDCAASTGYGQGPDTSPGPSPSNARSDYED